MEASTIVYTGMATAIGLAYIPSLILKLLARFPGLLPVPDREYKDRGAHPAVVGGIVHGGTYNPSPVRAAKVKAKDLMTPNEVHFFNQLKKALPEYHIAPQVSMGALMQPTLSEDSPNFKQALHAFHGKMVDFVVMDKKTANPLLLIELDDRTHDVKKHQDAARDAMTAAAGYKTVRWDSRAKPDVAEIRSTVNQLLASA